MSGYYLLDHPNPNGNHFYTTRRKKVKAGVVHITAGLEDLDMIGEDNSAEATARYAATTTRDVSWHGGSDWDTFLYLLPFEYTAWQCVDYNSTTVGWEISKRSTDWRDNSIDWVDAVLTNAANGLKPFVEQYDIPLRHATKAELDHAIATDGPPVGFISHWQLDPTRRTDPGLVKPTDTFPWNLFFSKFKTAVPPQEDDMFEQADRNRLVHVDNMLSNNNTVSDVNGLVTDMVTVKSDIAEIKQLLENLTTQPNPSV